MKEIKGVWLPDDDEHFEGHLLKGPTFEDHGTYQFAKCMGAIETVPANCRMLALDIGGHVGLWSMILCRYFDKVEAFEPIPELAECFERNVAGHQNVRLHRVALVGDANTIVSLRKPTNENSGNYRVVAPGESPVDTDIPALATILDDVEFYDPIGLIKIDVEGYETAILEGGEETVRAHRPVVLVEQKPGNAETYGRDQFAAKRLLEKWGACVCWSKAGDYCMEFKD